MEGTATYGTTGVEKNITGEIVDKGSKNSRKTIVFLVYCTLVMDNILLTVVVPIIPVFLYQMEHLEAPKNREMETRRPANFIDENRPRISNVWVTYPGKGPVKLPPDKTLINFTPELEAALMNRKPDAAKRKPEVKEVVRHIFETSFTGPFASDNENKEKLIQENGRVGALFASKAFVQLLVNPFIGIATQKYGYERPFLVGTGLLLLSAAIFSVVSSFPWLLIARSLQGLASASIAIAGMGLVAKLYSDEQERSRVMGLVLGGIAAGVLIGYPLGGFLFDFVGESSPFILISLATFALWGLQLHHIHYEIIDKDNIEGPENDENQSESPSFRKLFSDKYIRVVTGAIWVSTTAMALLEPCLPIWLMDSIHPEKWQLGTVFLPDSFGYLIGTNFFAVPALKVGRHRMAIAALLCVGMSAFCIPLASSMWDLVLPHFGLGLGIGVVDSSLMPMLATLVDEEGHGSAYGSVYSIAQTAVSLAYGLGPLLGGKFAEYFGFPNVMRTVGIINFCYIPMVLILNQRGQGRAKKEEMEGYELASVESIENDDSSD